MLYRIRNTASSPYPKRLQNSLCFSPSSESFLVRTARSHMSCICVIAGVCSGTNTSYTKHKINLQHEYSSVECADVSLSIRTLEVRVAVSDDIPAVQSLIKSLNQEKSICDDLDVFLQARRDPVCHHHMFLYFWTPDTGD